MAFLISPGLQFSSFLQSSMLPKKDLRSSPSSVFLDFTISQVLHLQSHTHCPPIPLTTPSPTLGLPGGEQQLCWDQDPRANLAFQPSSFSLKPAESYVTHLPFGPTSVSVMLVSQNKLVQINKTEIWRQFRELETVMYRRLRQKQHEFKNSLGHLANSCPCVSFTEWPYIEEPF